MSRAMPAAQVGVTALPDLSRKDFLRIRELAQQKFGLDLRDGKEKLVASRLAKQVRAGNFRSFSDYVEHVMDDRTGESLVNLINALSTNHTSFFREMRHFEFLATRILPHYAAGAFRVWSAACSSGEEPYSIAMQIIERPAHLRPKITSIVATDVSTKVLDIARIARYPKERVDGMPAALQGKYFTRAENGQVAVCADIRRMVDFRRLNLMETFHWHTPFELIFCRNVMIYFNRSTQENLVQRLGGCLVPGGYLFVGHSESLTAIEHGLEYVEPAIYRKPGGDLRKPGER